MTDHVLAYAPPEPRASRTPWYVLTLLTILAVVYLRLQGRIWWCECGRPFPISLRIDSHNSQHLFDAYSLSHVLHGVLFFGLFWLFRNRLSLPWRLVGASAIEIGWELLENSPIIINRYRSATVSLGYTGDSIANSLADIVSFIVGFYIAKRIGLWWSIGFFLFVELAMVWLIRDNLMLNVLMLLWPIDAIRRWQAGG